MISVHSSPLGRLGTQDTGGMSVYIRELSRQMGLRGHRVDIYTRAGENLASGEAAWISKNVRLIPLGMGPGADAPKTALFPHLVGFFRGMDRFRRREAISYDLIHSHYWLSGRVGQVARRAWGTPHITTFHTLAAAKQLAVGAGSDPEVRMAVERDLVAAVDRVLVSSEPEKENLVRLYDAEPDRVATVPCGVDLEVFRPRDKGAARLRIGVGADDSLVLYVGRFAPEKGLDRLLQAVARLKHIPRLQLLVVGGDGEHNPARRRMADLSLACGIADRVAFIGRVEQEELPWYYSAADLLALPSSYESFGMVALEALACGTPVAATRVGATERLLRDPRNGRLAPDFRPASLAVAVEHLLGNRAAAAQSAAAVRRSVARYDWSRVSAEVLAIYQDCLAEAGSAIPDAPLGLHPETGREACCGCGAFNPA
jgi:D-inositol-3-phosphate glycosyltransferase